jgi:vitamin B12 transporter
VVNTVRHIFWLLLCLPAFGANEEGTLGDTVVEVPAIEVRGRRPTRESPPSEFPGQRLEIETGPQGSLSDVMSRLPSVMPRGSTSESNQPEFLIRGQDSIQNRFFLNDIPLTDSEFNQTNLSLVPLISLRSVDVYPEGTPLFLAEDGLSGSANLLLKSPENDREITFGAKFGSYNYAQVFGRVPFKSAVGRASVSVELTRSDEDFVYFNDNGTPFNVSDDSLSLRTNNGFERITLLPQIELFQNRQHHLALLSVNAFSRNEIPGATNLPLNGVLSELYSMSALQYEGKWSDSTRVNANLFFKYTSDDLTGSDSSISLIPSQSLDLSGGMRANVKQRLVENVNADFVTGLSVDRFLVSIPDAGGISPPKSRFELPLGTSVDWKMTPEFSVRPAVLSHLYYYSLPSTPSVFGVGGDAPATRSYFLASPRLGTEWKPDRSIQFHASAGSFYRAPTMYELYGAPTGISASQNLTYESAVKADIGGEWEWRRPVEMLNGVRLSYTYFASRANNLIAYVQNSAQTRVAVNVGQSLIYGHEVQAEIESRWGIKTRFGGEFLWTENLSNIDAQLGKQLPGRPPYRVMAELSYSSEPLDVGYLITWMGPSYEDLPNVRQLSLTTDHSAYVTLRTKRWGTVGLEVKNIFNVITADSTFGTVQTTDNTTGYLGYPSPGRRIYVIWKYELG